MKLAIGNKNIRKYGVHFKREDSHSLELEDKLLLEAIRIGLPQHYDFEIVKTVKRINELRSQSGNDQEFTVYLQMPEGLLIFSQSISLILQYFGDVQVVILGDITYGGCCIEDQLMKIIEASHSESMGSSLLVHYAHSCLIPFEELTSHKELDVANVLYVFVEIHLLADHFINTIKQNFGPEKKIALLSTIQYHSTIVDCLNSLNDYFVSPVKIPVCDPLAWGETLGCTSAIIDEETEICIFLSDGRFHLESAMIQNPHKKFFLYEPFSKKIMEEKYNHQLLHEIRKNSIIKSYEITKEYGKNQLLKEAKLVGIFFSTLGRQGSFGLIERLEKLVNQYNNRKNRGPKIYTCIIFASDLSSECINNSIMEGIDYSIQLACPRLSTDWGEFYKKPILNSYEGFVLMGNLSTLNFKYFDDLKSDVNSCISQYSYRSTYPMNYWASKADIWCNYYSDESRNGSYSATKEQIGEIKLKIKRNKFKNLSKRKIDIKYDGYPNKYQNISNEDQREELEKLLKNQSLIILS